MRIHFAAAFAAAAVTVLPAAADDLPPPPTVPRVDLARYAGVWHELARYENRFQGPDCLNVTAEYTRDGDGGVDVVNTCRDAAGVVTETAEGNAYVADKETGAKLRVSFFWPFYGDYWVVGLADDYSWAIVSAPGRDYLWLLTRDREPSPELRDLMLAKAAALGFDTSKLYFSQRPTG